MAKRFFVLCSAVVFSLFVFSCAEVRTSSVSVKIPESVARSVINETSGDTDFTLVVKISGDYSLEKSFKIKKSSLSSSIVYTLEELPAGAKISLEVSLLQGTVAYYKTSEASEIILAAGENSANVELVRVTSIANITLDSDFSIVARYVGGSEINDGEEVSFNKEVEFDTYLEISDVSYIWSLNGTEISGETGETLRCTFSQMENALLDEENIISCTAIVDENSTRIVEFKFTLVQTDSE